MESKTEGNLVFQGTQTQSEAKHSWKAKKKVLVRGQE